MAVEVRGPQQAQNSGGALGILGSTVGKIWGPVGSVVGGAVGNMLGGQKPEQQGGAILDLVNAGRGGENSSSPKISQANDMNTSTPVNRWQENQMNLTAMNQGMKALEANPQLKQTLAPVLSDAMKRAQGVS